MFEARLSSTALLKKIVDALKEILHQSTLDCSDSGIQASSHLSFPWVKTISNFTPVAGHGQFACLAGIHEPAQRLL